MHHTQDPGKVSLMDGTQGVNRLSMPEHITSGNAGTRYRRLLHRHCASLNLETAFKQIKISQDIQLECVQSAEMISADAEHSHQEHCAPLHHQCLPILVVTMKIFPSWWKISSYMYCTLLCNPPWMRKLIEKLQPFVGHQYIIG